MHDPLVERGGRALGCTSENDIRLAPASPILFMGASLQLSLMVRQPGRPEGRRQRGKRGARQRRRA